MLRVMLWVKQSVKSFESKRLGVWFKTPRRFLKPQVLFLKPLDVFIWSSDKTRVGLAGRPTRFMLED